MEDLRVLWGSSGGLGALKLKCQCFRFEVWIESVREMELLLVVVVCLGEIRE